MTDIKTRSRKGISWKWASFGVGLVALALVLVAAHNSWKSPNAYSATLPPAGLVGHWTFNDGSVTASVGSVNGVIQGKPSAETGAGCAVGGCLHFHGENKTKDVVLLNAVPITPSFTVSVWAKSDTPTWNAHGWIAAARAANGFIIHPNFRENRWGGYIVDSSAQYHHIGTATVTDITKPHAYALSYDAVKKEAVMYVDGVSVATKSMTVSRVAGKVNMSIGKDEYSNERYGLGTIDEVRVYDRALTDEEMKTLQESATTPGAKPVTNAIGSDLIAQWHFDEGRGTTAADSSGHGNKGAIGGSASWVDRASGKAIQFSGNGQKVTLDAPPLDLGKKFSIGFFVKFNALEGDSVGSNPIRIVSRDYYPNNWYVIDLTKTEIEFEAQDSGKCPIHTSIPYQLEIGRWYHLAFVVNEDTHTTRYYVNGQSQATKEHANKTCSQGFLAESRGIPLTIGSNWGKTFKGAMDEFAIYRRALGADEIQTLAKAGQGSQAQAGTGDEGSGSETLAPAPSLIAEPDHLDFYANTDTDCSKVPDKGTDKCQQTIKLKMSDGSPFNASVVKVNNQPWLIDPKLRQKFKNTN